MERIAACPASWRASKDVPRTSSAYADRGTLLHDLGAMTISNRVLTTDRHCKREGIVLARDERAAVLLYARHCRKLCRKATYWAIEQSLAYTVEMFGTPDFHAVCGDTLHIVDLKTGTGVYVEADNNVQLQCYAVLAFSNLPVHIQREIKRVALTIVQPLYEGARPIRTADYPVESIPDWQGEINLAIERAKNPNARFSPGEHCRFCPAKPSCPALMGVAQAFPNATLHGTLTPVQVGEMLQKVDTIEIWIKALRELAHEAIGHGIPIPGWKLQDKRAVRKWTDEKAVIKTAEANGIVAREYKLMTPAALAKRHGSMPAQLLPFIDQTPSGQNLVRDASTDVTDTSAPPEVTLAKALEMLQYRV